MPKSPDNTSNISEKRSWRSVYSQPGANSDAAIALVGAPLGLESLSPDRCDLAQDAIRTTLKHIGVLDLEVGTDFSAPVILIGGSNAVTRGGTSDRFCRPSVSLTQGYVPHMAARVGSIVAAICKQPSAMPANAGLAAILSHGAVDALRAF